MADSFQSEGSLKVADREYSIFRLAAVEKKIPEAASLPFSLKILLENLLRHEDGRSVRAADIEALARWNPTAEPDREIAFAPSRVLLQDFTGVPAIVDLAAMRDAMKLGGDPSKINPLQPVELVIDHSVQVDSSVTWLSKPTPISNLAAIANATSSSNGVRKRSAKVVPDTGIVHQVNLEYSLAVFTDETSKARRAIDTLRRHRFAHHDQRPGRPGLGRRRYRSRGAMLNRCRCSFLGSGSNLRAGCAKARPPPTWCDGFGNARKKGVVGSSSNLQPGLAACAGRATIANMAPEYTPPRLPSRRRDFAIPA